MSYLQIENMSCGYARGFHLKPISLNLSKGDFAGIIGKNGSGKSTFFKGLVGDIPLLGGTVMLGGVNLSTLRLKEKSKRLAIVSQFIEVSPISVQEFVLMGRIPYRDFFQFSYTDEDLATANKYMELTGISHLKDRLVSELSGGQQQIAAIASALTQQPDILLLDEPTSHLDISYQAKIMNILQRLNQEENMTVVMIIHDLNMAGEYCNHLTLMKEGKAIRQGSPNEVLTFTNIEEAYDTPVLVKKNPISGRPVVFPISLSRLEAFNKQTTENK